MLMNMLERLLETTDIDAVDAPRTQRPRVSRAFEGYGNDK